MTRRPLRLNRRTFLRGSVAGASVMVGLGPLDCMFDGRGRAYGATAYPKRLVLLFFGNGAYPPNWVPSAQGAAPPLPQSLELLAPVRRYVRVVSGLDSGGGGHETGNVNTLMGKGKTTFDQLAVPTLGAGTRFPSVQYGLFKELKGGIYQANTTIKDGRALPPELDPKRAFDRLFGAGFVPPPPPGGGTTPPPAPDPNLERLRQRKLSVIDGVKQELARMQPLLGAADRAKLDAHLTALRELERSLQPLTPGAGGSSGAACDPKFAAGATDYVSAARQWIQIMTMAIACDQTRVVSYQFGGVQCQFTGLSQFVPGIPNQTWHDHSHKGGWETNITKICRWLCGQMGELIAGLAAIPEGAGNLMDSTGMLISSETSFANPHGGNDMPIVLAGGPSILRGDFHWRGSGAMSGAASLSLLQALGCPVTALGSETRTIPLT